MFENLKVDVTDLMPLKKVLFKFWKHFRDDDFFFIGATIGKHTYREFCDYVAQYNLKSWNLDAFVALNLKKDLCSINLDESTGAKEIALALYHLKSMTDSIKFYPFINRIEPNLKKYFADIPPKLPYLAAVLWYVKLYKGLTATKYLPEDFVIGYFKRFFNMSPDFFRENAYIFFDVERLEVDGEISVNLESLVEFEEVIYQETRPSSSFEDSIIALKVNGSNIDDFLSNLPGFTKKLFESVCEDKLNRKLDNLTKELNKFG